MLLKEKKRKRKKIPFMLVILILGETVDKVFRKLVGKVKDVRIAGKVYDGI